MENKALFDVNDVPLEVYLTYKKDDDEILVFANALDEHSIIGIGRNHNEMMLMGWQLVDKRFVKDTQYKPFKWEVYKK